MKRPALTNASRVVPAMAIRPRNRNHPEAFARLDLDYLTDHITAVSMAALGIGPPLDFGDTAAVSAAAGGGRA